MEIFTDEYVKQEIDFMDIADKHVDIGAPSDQHVRLGRWDDYLNVNYRADSLTFPVYKLNGTALEFGK